MSGKRDDIDADDAVGLYLSGLTIKAVGERLGCSDMPIKRLLREAGVRPRSRLIATDDVAMAAAHVGGESVKAIAERLGLTRTSVANRLRKQGVVPRNRSQSMRVRMAQATPAERQALSAAAHDAVRGKPASRQQLLKTAQAYEARGDKGSSPAEKRLLHLLRRRGLRVVPQKAFGVYNCDLAVDPVAVEVMGGGWHWHGKRRRIIAERTRYILDAGWDVLMLVVTHRHPVTPDVAEHIAAYVQQRRRDHAAGREYRMIRGAGQLMAAGRADDDKISLVPAFTCGRDPITGQYKLIPR